MILMETAAQVQSSPYLNALAAFFHYAIEAAWDGNDLNGADIQEKALELGLIKPEKYDPNKHDFAVEDPDEEVFVLCDENEVPGDNEIIAQVSGFRAIVERGETGYAARAPELPGCCVAFAKTEPEVMKRIEEAIALHMKALGKAIIPEQREAHARSFAYGNCKIDNPNVTREMIDRAADEPKRT